MGLQTKRLPQRLRLKSTLITSLFFRTALTFVVLIIMCAVAWLMVTQQNSAAQRAESQKLNELHGLMREIESLRAQVDLYKQYSEQYKTLVEEGGVKQQSRVHWVDAMVKLQQTLVMPSFHFKFLPAIALNTEHFQQIAVDKTGFHFSRLELNMGLQHEADLFTFLKEFSAQINPLFLVERCLFESRVNVAEQAVFNPDRANIKVDCVLTLFHPYG